MTISEDQVVKSLISFYRSQGIDLSTLFTNPLFEKLPLDKKVEAVKKYAAEIRDGINDNRSRYEKLSTNTETVIGGIKGMAAGSMASLAALKAIEAITGKSIALSMGHNKILSRVVLSGGLIGAGLGAISGFTKSYPEQVYRRTVKNYAGVVAKNPTDENAIGLLSANRTMIKDTNPISALAPEIFGNEIKNRMDSYLHTSMGGLYDRIHKEEHPDFYENLPPDLRSKLGY
jgi:hypothetical protein